LGSTSKHALIDFGMEQDDSSRSGQSLPRKILRATRIDRVTRKVNSPDRSAGSQCHSVFTQPKRTCGNLLRRADYGNVATEVKVVVVESCIKHSRHGATNGQQQHGQRATAHIIVVIISLRIRNTRGSTLAGGNLF
jgi:hypothetical protein